MGLSEYTRILLKWHDEGSTNLLSRLNCLYKILQTDDIATPLSTKTLEAIAERTHKAMTKNVDVTQSLERDVYRHQYPHALTQHDVTFDYGDMSTIGRTLQTLKQSSHKDEIIPFVEKLTATERMLNQLQLNQTVLLNNVLYKRTPCARGKTGIGCCLYQLSDATNRANVSLGIYLSKREIDRFYKTGELPEGHENRNCILCNAVAMKCHTLLQGTKGVGQNSTTNANEPMYYQDIVNCAEGYKQKYMIMPSQGNHFPNAPFLDFHPSELSFLLRGDKMYVDESKMFFRPNEEADF
jgi:hypothetical protein